MFAGPEHQQRRGQRAGGDHDDVGTVGRQLIAEADMHARNGVPGRVGLETIDVGARHERDVLVAACRIDADDLRVGLAVGAQGG